MKVRPATPADIPAMIEQASHSASAAHWTVEAYQRIFAAAGPRRLALVLQDDSAQPPAGFLVALCSGPEWELENIVVAGAARRRGLARCLLAELLYRARAARVEAVVLEVRESNVAARALYESCAFVPSGRRPVYYAHPLEDALIYRFVFSTATI